jgi:tetratricopeptide (TPR) repeat protein
MATQTKQKQTTIKPKPSAEVSASKELRDIYAFIFLFSFAIYFNSLFNDYNLDDELVTQNHRLTSKGISAIPEIFTSPYYEDKAGYKYEYRPIVLVTFAIEHSIFGDNPHISHFFNVVLYALLCLLLFHLLRQLFKDYNILFIAGIVLLFAAHPIHTEVVASIKNRDEILALGFSLAAMHYALQYKLHGGLFKALIVPALLLLGILSKSSAITFSILIPALLIVFTNGGFKQILFLTLLLSVPMLVYARLYSILQQIVVVGGMSSAIVTLYAIKNFEETINTCKRYIAQLTGSSNSMQVAPTTVIAQLSFNFLQTPVVLLALLGITLLLSGVSVFAMNIGHSLLISILFFAFSAFYFLVKDEIKLLLITPIVLLCSYALIKFPSVEKAIEIPVVVFLCIQLLRKQKEFTVVALLNYILFAATSVFVAKSYFFLMGLLFVGLYNPRLRPVSIALGAAFLILWIKNVYGFFSAHRFSLTILKVPVLFSGFVVAWAYNRYFKKGVEVFFIPVLFCAYFLLEPHTAHNPVVPVIKEAYSNINKVDAIDLTPVQAVRPLKFIEYPLEKTDPFRLKLGTYMTVLGKYLKLIVFPYPLSFYYGYAYIVPTDVTNTVPLLAIGMHVVLVLLALYLLRKNALIAGAILIYTIGVVVFSGLFIPIPGMMGDRFLFIPSIGFSILVAWLFFFFSGQSVSEKSLTLSQLKPASKYGLSIVLVIYSLFTLARNSDWKDRITLFRKDIKVVEQSAQAQNLLGLHLFMASGKEQDAIKQVQLREEAVTHFQKAISIYPEFLNASFDLGRTYESLGKLDEAYKAYERTMQIDTKFVAPCFNMALIQDNKGNLDMAIPLYERYLTKYPYRKEVYANLSFAYFKKRDFTNSINVNKRLLRVMPGTYEPTINIAKTYFEMGRKDSAYVYFQQSYSLNPRDVNVRMMLDQLKKELTY